MKVKLANGQEVEALPVNFEPFKEPFSEYHLDDGTVLRIKFPLVKIRRTEERNPDGTRAYQYEYAPVMSVDEPQERVN
jgi:hypothetical protein